MAPLLMLRLKDVRNGVEYFLANDVRELEHCLLLGVPIVGIQ
jgi:hypothetical protein